MNARRLHDSLADLANAVANLEQALNALCTIRFPRRHCEAFARDIAYDATRPLTSQMTVRSTGTSAS